MIANLQEVIDNLQLSKKEETELRQIHKKYPIKVTKHWLSLMESENSNDPLRKQVIPTTEKLVVNNGEILAWDNTDDCHGIIEHKYPNRVAMLVTKNCASHCVYCVRQINNEKGRCELDLKEANYTEIDVAIKYIVSHQKIDDVLLTGGDAFMLPIKKLDYILNSLRQLAKNVRIIRLGTRVPNFDPNMVSSTLINIISKYTQPEKPIYIGIQFNHPQEISEKTKLIFSKMVKAGFILYSQTVLLKGINDKANILAELFTRLVQNRVQPYYLYHAMPTVGTMHLRTSVQKGVQIMQKLQGNISGLALPKYIIADKYGGKIPIPYREVRYEDGKVVTRNYKNKEVVYR